MIAPGLRRGIVTVVVAAAASVQVSSIAPAGAAGASAWAGDSRSALRLVAGTPAGGGGALRAGVEIRLAPGWKTYWRYPGDSGVAPRFDFSRSSNLKSVEVGWPAPQAWQDEGGTSIGYKETTVLPLRVAALDPARPVKLALAFDYAICERLCVPVSGSAELTIPVDVPTEDALLAAAEARLPKKSTLGAGTGSAIAIRAIAREGDWPRPRIVVDVAAPAGDKVELFAEGPGADWALPVPQPAGEGRDDTRRFAFRLDGVPPGIDPKGATLTLTAVAGAAAVEIRYRLD
jgi:DsbC/DsbD-like thiol-disulfide interchange protein